MRNNIVRIGSDALKYEIREIVEVAKRFEKTGIPIIWENIGDPIAKGYRLPDWIKEIVIDIVRNDNSACGYSPTKGVESVRDYLAEQRNARNGVRITVDDILFYNGLGDAISSVYHQLHHHARIIGPSPAYPTHSSAESAHAGYPHITYALDPKNEWKPNMLELENKIAHNPHISGILIINPDNPTGMVYSRETLEHIIDLAKRYDLFIMSDEIYEHISYGPEPMTPLSEIIDDVPGIAMKGLSKEIPWPGGRCGWIEMYNRHADPIFHTFTESLINAKMLEVCSTTLPQKTIPKLFSDDRYAEHLKTMNEIYKSRAEYVYQIFSEIPSICAPKPGGSFYYSIAFDREPAHTLKPLNTDAEMIMREVTRDVAPDYRFAYELIAATGICVVPLSSMNTNTHGFRITLLEPDEEKFKKIMQTVAEQCKLFLG